MYFTAGIIAILLVIVITTCYNKEHMTKIRRGVGFLNDGDETPIASGIIHSAPIFDLTHTYFDGTADVSCDECPNRTICPKCPQYKTVERFGLSTGLPINLQIEGYFDSDNQPGMIDAINDNRM